MLSGSKRVDGERKAKGRQLATVDPHHCGFHGLARCGSNAFPMTA